MLPVKLLTWLLNHENALYSLRAVLLGVLRERKIAGQEELQFDTLIPFKNHPDRLEYFSYNVVNYTSEPAPRHFVEALEAVMSTVKRC